MADFGDLLQSAEQLTADFEALGGGGVPLATSSSAAALASDLPRVDRSLRELVEAGQQLFSKTRGGGGGGFREPSGAENEIIGTQGVKASVLLGSRGVDLTGMRSKLDLIACENGIGPAFVGVSAAAAAGSDSEPDFRDTRDMATFLRNERENAILTVVEETRRDTLENADRLHWDSVLKEWDRDKNRILDELSSSAASMGTAVATATDEFLLASGRVVVSSKLHDPTLGGGSSSLDDVEMAYAGKVAEYNDAVIKGGLKPDLARTFASCFPRERDHEAALMWEMVAAMLGGLVDTCRKSSRSTTTAPTKGDEVARDRIRSATTNAIVGRAKGYLEKAFAEHVRATVCSDLRKAMLGGIPGTYPMVRSYLNVKPFDTSGAILEDGLVDGVPVWPMIFYCLRCGDYDAAIKAAADCGSGLAEMVKLVGEAKASPDHSVSHHTENMLKISYKRSVRTSSDPFKRAVYCILGACDPSDEHPEVATSLDDYLWIKLSQVREVAAAPTAVIGGDDVLTSSSKSSRVADTGRSSADVLTLASLQRLLAEDYGEAHFNAAEQPILYFQVLFLTGQFEAAIEFLFRVERLRPHGVHIGLAFHANNLLIEPASVQAPLMSALNLDHLLSATAATAPSGGPRATTTVKQLNLARLVILYARKFEGTDPREALNYYFFLRDLRAPDAAGNDLFTSCVSELVLESREFDLLLGKVMPDGARLPGLLDRFQGPSQTDVEGFGSAGRDARVRRIIEAVAEDSERRGMFEDSIKLYDLFGKQQKVVELLNKLLAQVVAQVGVPESRRDRLQKLAIEIAKRYRSCGSSASIDTSATFYLLLDLMTFFDFYHAKRIDEAKDIISKIKVVPLDAGDVDSMVSTFRLLSDEVRRSIPEVLLATMNIIFNTYKSERASPAAGMAGGTLASGQDGGQEKYLEELKGQAKAIITYAGMIPYRMPGDTNARLVQMEVMMS